MANVGTMDFFGHQDDARKKSSLLVFYYILAVICIIFAVYGAFALVIFGTELKRTSSETVDLARLWNPDVFLYVLIGTVVVVVSGTLYKIAQLGRGGDAVARMLGGRKIAANTSDPAERRLLNVVEEMSIASGTPVASVYVLDGEQGINAFAAGFSPSDAVIAATRGCIEKLNRDELQGVVAHEFSHILNGDMRLNIKLTGVLHGILLIGLIGYWIMRSSGSRSSSRSRGKGGGQIVILGLLLWIIGYIGVLFGKLIKSAVSRQREFLADASAVQFTRNPAGIAGALKKIGGISSGSRVMNANAEQASHFFFANGLAGSLMSAFATHPPLEERIRRIDPSFTGGRTDTGSSSSSHSAASGFTADTSSGATAHGSRKIAVDTADVVSSVGQPGQSHLAYASKLLSTIPASVAQAIRDPSSARAAIYCLLLSEKGDVRASQKRYLEANSDAACSRDVKMLEQHISALGPEYKIPVADIAVSALKEMSNEQYNLFISNVEWLAAADQEIDLFEFALKGLVERRLRPVFGKVDKVPIQFYDLKPLAGDACRLLSCIAYWGADTMDQAVPAFNAGTAKMGLDPQAITDAGQCGLDMVEKAVARLNHASPLVKRRIIEGCVQCVAVDGMVTVNEAELIRAIADGLDCPVPPLTAGPLNDAA